MPFCPVANLQHVQAPKANHSASKRYHQKMHELIEIKIQWGHHLKKAWSGVGSLGWDLTLTPIFNSQKPYIDRSYKCTWSWTILGPFSGMVGKRSHPWAIRLHRDFLWESWSDQSDVPTLDMWFRECGTLRMPANLILTLKILRSANGYRCANYDRDYSKSMDFLSSAGYLFFDFIHWLRFSECGR